MNIVIVDYGLGNLASVYNALNFLGVKPSISRSAREIEKADKIVLPGVGAFHDAMHGLKDRKLIEPLKESIIQGKPYLGICLGLQLLFQESEEGQARGLGIFKGKVRRFRERDGIKVPHIGWNAVARRPQTADHGPQTTVHGLMRNIKDKSYFYFDHSYYATPVDKSIVVALTDYGVNFASMINKDNIFAVQFHPEKSQALGIKLLENFIKL